MTKTEAERLALAATVYASAKTGLGREQLLAAGFPVGAMPGDLSTHEMVLALVQDELGTRIEQRKRPRV